MESNFTENHEFNGIDEQHSGFRLFGIGRESARQTARRDAKNPDRSRKHVKAGTPDTTGVTQAEARAEQAEMQAAQVAASAPATSGGSFSAPSAGSFADLSINSIADLFGFVFKALIFILLFQLVAIPVALQVMIILSAFAYAVRKKLSLVISHWSLVISQ